jgi:hypothetical protein
MVVVVTIGSYVGLRSAEELIVTASAMMSRGICAHQRLSNLDTHEVQLKRLETKLHNGLPEIWTDSCSFSLANFFTEISGIRMRHGYAEISSNHQKSDCRKNELNFGPELLVLAVLPKPGGISPLGCKPSYFSNSFGHWQINHCM